MVQNNRFMGKLLMDSDLSLLGINDSGTLRDSFYGGCLRAAAFKQGQV